MNRKRNTTIIIVIFVIAIAVIITSTFYPPAKSIDSGGTIGVVKKYNSGQMSQKDVKLKNILIKDSATIKKSVASLKEYKSFVTGLAFDLGKWNESIENAKKNNKKSLKDENILTLKAASFSEYKTYIEKNIGVVENTINLFSIIIKGDTLNPDLGIENTIVAYENFRIQINQKFETMLSSIPLVHNAFVKNGMKGIIGNTAGTMGIFVTNSSQTMASMDYQNAVVGNNVTFAVVALNGIEINSRFDNISNKIDLGAQALGNAVIGVYMYSANSSLGSYTLKNITANSRLVQNADLSNTAAGRFILGGGGNYL